MSVRHFTLIKNDPALEYLEFLDLQLVPVIVNLDLSNHKQLKTVVVRGVEVTNDSPWFSEIIQQIPTTIRRLELIDLTVDNLDLSKFNNIDELEIKRLKSPMNTHTISPPARITWPGTTGSNRLHSLVVEDTTFQSQDLNLSGTQFSRLKTLKIENTMNNRIVLKDLKDLKELRISIARFVVGHLIKVFLIDCPQLQFVRTTPSVKKYIWNCPQLLTEFGRNRMELERRPSQL